MDEETKRGYRQSIERWENRPRYTALDPQTLAAIPDDLLEQAILDFVWAHDVGDVADKIALLQALPDGFRTIYTTWHLDAEVANGGFHQYFWNTEGQYADLAAAALARLGADDHARLFAEAWTIWEREGKPDLSQRGPQQQLEAFSGSATSTDLADLDSRWYGLGELADIRLTFIRRHPELFTARVPS